MFPRWKISISHGFVNLRLNYKKDYSLTLLIRHVVSKLFCFVFLTEPILRENLWNGIFK